MVSDAVGGDPPRGVLPSRRLVLRGAFAIAAGALLDGCHGSPRLPGATSAASTGLPGRTTPDPDVGLLVSAIGREQRLARLTSTAIRQFAGQSSPSQSNKLHELLAIQQAHVQRLRAAFTAPRALPDVRPPLLPAQQRDLVPTLARFESRAESACATDCLLAVFGPLAMLLGSVAASHAEAARWLGADVPASLDLRPPQAGGDVAALAPCLAAENAAVYAYGVLGGVLRAGESSRPLARRAVASYDAHRSRRDVLVTAITAAPGTPPPAEPAYTLPFAVTGPATAARLARYVESRCARVYATAIAATSGDSRRFVSAVLIDCAERAAAWGARPSAFPGLRSD